MMHELRHTRLRILQEYFYAADKFVQTEIVHAQDRVTMYVETKPPPAHLDIAIKELEHVQQQYPLHLRYSFILLTASTIEDAIRKCCRDHTPSPLMKPPFEAVWPDLKKHISKCGFLPADSSHWLQVDYIMQLRNVITHGGGFLSRSKTKARDCLQHLAEIENDFHIDPTTTQVLFKKTFCDTVLLWGDRFFDAIEEGVKHPIWMSDCISITE